MKRALITGITGQDGYYLTEHLLNNDYMVCGLVRRHSNHEGELGNAEWFRNHLGFSYQYGDLTDVSSLETAISRFQPHEVYNLGAQSHVGVSFSNPQLTMQINAVGTLNILEVLRRIAPYTRFYQASTSEMFGNQIDGDGFQRETTPMIPVSPYGISKLVGHNLCHQYRNSYGMFCCSGILFNHESPFRGGNFVTQKVVRGAVAIKNGLKQTLKLGNLKSIRDWGHAKDYVKAMHLMLQHDKPDDYVVATGEANTIEYLVMSVFGQLDLRWDAHVEIADSLKRPEDVEFLRGDATKIVSTLGWKREYDFDRLLEDMINAETKTLWP